MNAYKMRTISGLNHDVQYDSVRYQGYKTTINPERQ